MAGKEKRITIVVTPDMETLLSCAKKDFFYNCTRSEMVRRLISVGLKAARQGEMQVGKEEN